MDQINKKLKLLPLPLLKLPEKLMQKQIAKLQQRQMQKIVQQKRKNDKLK